MGSLNFADLPDGALLLVDTAPIIYILEDHPEFAPRFQPVFKAHETGRLRFALSAITIAEVLTGPLKSGNEALAERYLAILQSWQVIPVDAAIAAGAARLRASLGLKLADAVQAASALSINAAALLTHDRDFSRIHTLRIIS
ncbi:MAG TPA: PIN domain-containing protein [Magnetospirillaceae bacterium]|nr:PIN domain-containing protein [Magnetospirillaceae bacterium]